MQGKSGQIVSAHAGLSFNPLQCNPALRKLEPDRTVTVRIGAIPRGSNWRIAGEHGQYLGVEVGAELFPLLDLDEFVVFVGDA